MANRRPLIAHVVHHFHVGGMENGMINLINNMPADQFRHAVICLDGYSDFRLRIQRNDVAFYALAKRPGRGFGWYLKLWRLLRKLRPQIVHTRNVSAIEGQFVAMAAGISARVHGEHGRDVFDLHGKNHKYNLLRKAARRFIKHYITVSKDLEQWLRNTVGVNPSHITQIYNGVDIVRFCPRTESRENFGPAGFADTQAFVIGSVGRMAEVKDYPTLVRAFLQMLDAEPAARHDARLVIIGDGVTRTQCLEILQAANARQYAWLPGERSDIPELLRALDLFVLPSLGEGISNTILEAMASGLPVVATEVGGNPELIAEGENGALVTVANQDELAQTLLKYYRNREMVKTHGKTSRSMVESRFSIPAMVNSYMAVYGKVLGRPQ